MSEQDSSTSEIDWTPTALGFARAYYAGALLAAQQEPGDQHRQQRAAEAWVEYQDAAREAGLSNAFLPGDSRREQNEAY